MNFSTKKDLFRFLFITSGSSNGPTYRMLIYIKLYRVFFTEADT